MFTEPGEDMFFLVKGEILAFHQYLKKKNNNNNNNYEIQHELELHTLALILNLL